MRRFCCLYIVLLLVQYTFNPFVPPPKLHSTAVRYPQSVALPPPRLAPGVPVHTDELGLIVQSDGDGGDTAQRTGMFYYLHNDAKGFQKALDLLEISPGIFVRHPTQGGFRSDPRRFSLDQQRPLIIAMGKYGMKPRLWRMLLGQMTRLGKYQNLDFISPVGIGEYIRALDLKALYPLLLVTDASLVLSSLHLVSIASLDPNEVDDNNHAMTLLQAQENMPTPAGWFALKVYLGLRPTNLGNSVLGKSDTVNGAFAWYHRAENGGNPLIGDAIYEALMKYDSNPAYVHARLASEQ
jgi:hypothetical protein